MSLFLSNLLAWSIQVAVIVPAGLLLPRLLRIDAPDALLRWRHMLLACCLILPFVQGRLSLSDDSAVTIIQSTSFVQGTGTSQSARIDILTLIPWVLGAGVLLRLCWVGLGIMRLRRYRLTARPLEVDAREALILESDHVSGPVTFGLVRPVVLVPSNFRQMSAELQRSILSHELVHVARRDWAVVLVEEIVRATLWFHPAIWWLLGQIHLAREQSVDRQVIELTGSRDRYLDALLAVAGSRLRPDLAPAPLFLTRRHLAERVALILKGVVMSKRRLMASLTVVASAVSVAGWLIVLQFPMRAPAQIVRSGGDNLLHRSAIEYPAAARERGIQGTVIVRATLDEKGNVADAQIVSGPEILRRAALKSVLDWHYSRTSGAPSTVDVAIDFQLPPQGEQRDRKILQEKADLDRQMLRKIEEDRAKIERFGSATIARIEFGAGVPHAVQEAVKSRLTVQVGDQFRPEIMGQVKQSIQEVDEHLTLGMNMREKDGNKEATLYLSYPNAAEPVGPAGASPARLRVGGNVQQEMLISKAPIKYPVEAKQARIQGTVRFSALIGKDGTVKSLEVVNGHPLLVAAAEDGVKQWVYKPTLLNGQPVEVSTMIDVNFSLSQ